MSPPDLLFIVGPPAVGFRFNSEPGELAEIEWPEYVRIETTELSVDETARRIMEAFGL